VQGGIFLRFLERGFNHLKTDWFSPKILTRGCAINISLTIGVIKCFISLLIWCLEYELIKFKDYAFWHAWRISLTPCAALVQFLNIVRPLLKAKRQCCLYGIFIKLNFRFHTCDLIYPTLIRILMDRTHKWLVLQTLNKKHDVIMRNPDIRQIFWCDERPRCRISW